MKQWERRAAIRYSDFVSKIKGKKVRVDHIPENILNNWRTLWADEKLQKIVVVMGMKKYQELTRVTLLLLGSIARDLLLKRVKIQHQVRYIYTSIQMVMMENLLLVIDPESSTKNMRKY